MYIRPYRTSVIKEKEISDKIHSFLDAGLIQESNSPYSSPVILVMKCEEGEKT